MVETRVMRMHATGGPDVLRSETLDLREPGPGEILVRQVAAGLNWTEGANIVTTAVEFPANIYPWMSVDQLQNRVMNTARDKGPAGKDNDFGAGIADANQATGG